VELGDFTLTRGGLVYKVVRRIWPARSYQQRIGRLAIALTAIAWVPLLGFTAASGTALSGKVKVPFLFDFASYARFLIAVPVFIIAEVIVDRLIFGALKGLISADIISDSDAPRFDDAIRGVARLRDSVLAEAILIIFAYAGSYYGITNPLFKTTSIWIESTSGRLSGLTLAGWWYFLVSIPIFQFLLYRWLWRYAIWWWFLLHLSKLDLQLIPTHPDRVGGLNPINLAQVAFGLIILPASAVLSAIFAAKIIYAGASALLLEATATLFVIIILIVFLGPLTAFTPCIASARRRGLLEYGALAASYTRSFDRKWIRGDNPEGEPLLGTQDIQALADLGTSYGVLKEMRFTLYNIQTIIIFIAFAIIPMIPLLLILSSPSQLLGAVVKLLGRLIG